MVRSQKGFTASQSATPPSTRVMVPPDPWQQRCSKTADKSASRTPRQCSGARLRNRGVGSDPCFLLYSWTAWFHKSCSPRWRGKANCLSSLRQRQCFTAVISWRQGIGSKVEGSDETSTVIELRRCFSSPLLR